MNSNMLDENINVAKNNINEDQRTLKNKYSHLLFNEKYKIKTYNIVKLSESIQYYVVSEDLRFLIKFIDVPLVESDPRYYIKQKYKQTKLDHIIEYEIPDLTNNPIRVPEEERYGFETLKKRLDKLGALRFVDRGNGTFYIYKQKEIIYSLHIPHKQKDYIGLPKKQKIKILQFINTQY